MSETLFNTGTGKYFEVKAVVRSEDKLPKAKVYLRTVTCKTCKYLIYSTPSGYWYALYKLNKKPE